MTRTLTYVIPPEDDGRELKRVARSRLGLSHRVFTSMKAAGGLRLDGEIAHANRVVRAGQTLTATFEDDSPSEVLEDERPVTVAYEDDDVLVVDKDAPLACQCGLEHDGDALENRLAWRYRGENFVFRPVNRLDKGTSGLMVAAKNPHAQAKLQALLHSDAFAREYLAVLVGVPEPPEGRVDAPIGKADGATIRREVRADGKPSATRYRVLETKGSLSLVRLRLETGRTHQIRVHMAHIGCPVAGDFLYGREDERLPGRFALHSAYLRFPQPVTGEALEFSSPLPESLKKYFEFY